MKITKLFIVLVFFIVSVTDVYAVDVPSTLIITGSISGGTVVISKNDQILAVQPGSKTVVEGTGFVLDSSGDFSVTISKTTDFNGTDLTLILKKKADGAQYQLNDGKDPVLFQHAGSLFPAQINLSLKVGAKLVNGQPVDDNTDNSDTDSDNDNDSDSDSNSNDSNTTSSPYDVNNDGDINQQDIDLIKASVVQGGYNSAMDVNSDKIVNTRDIIETIKVFISNRLAGNPD